MKAILDILKDIPVNAAQRVRIESLEAEFKKISEENAALKQENAELQAKTFNLENELTKYRTSADKFIEYAGVKFRKLESGGYDKTIPYCPICETALHPKSIGNRRFHVCRCGFVAPFPVRNLGFATKDL